MAPIDYKLTIPPATVADDTIPGFLASQQTGSAVLLPGCTGACATNVLSAGQGPGPASGDASNPKGMFGAVTLFEFTFTTPLGGETFSVTHDDGVSLFQSGMEDGCTQTSPGGSYMNCGNDLLPIWPPAPQPQNLPRR